MVEATRLATRVRPEDPKSTGNRRCNIPPVVGATHRFPASPHVLTGISARYSLRTCPKGYAFAFRSGAQNLRLGARRVQVRTAEWPRTAQMEPDAMRLPNGRISAPVPGLTPEILTGKHARSFLLPQPLLSLAVDPQANNFWAKGKSSVSWPCGHAMQTDLPMI
jgi:hypothetical protein